MQPEEVKELRFSYGLTQKELSSLLGWGGATLSRYENGALQSESHDRLLKMIQDPKNLFSVLEEKRTSLPKTFVTNFHQRLERQIGSEEPTLKELFERKRNSFDADEFSGYSDLNLDKLFNSILLFAGEDGLFKTKLHKLLFFADFKHYKEHAVSITGVKYAHLPHGPVPDNYQLLLTVLVEENYIRLLEESIGDYVGEVVESQEKLDLNVFSPAEIKTLVEIQEHFAEFTSTEISELSHSEKGYLETSDGELISYQYAEALQI